MKNLKRFSVESKNKEFKLAGHYLEKIANVQYVTGKIPNLDYNKTRKISNIEK